MELNSKIINSIGLEGKPSDHKIAVAMSGGVDSSVAAALLHKAGYNVFGVSMHLYNEKIKVNKRLFMTATERFMRGSEDQVVSMKDEKFFGKTIQKNIFFRRCKTHFY